MAFVVHRRVVLGADRRRLEVGELGGVGAEAVGQGIGSVAREVPQVYSAVSWSLTVRL